jgi:DNA-binding beta-propeller fold protein YncE
MGKERKQGFFRVGAFALGMVFAAGSGHAEPTNYTYNYDMWGVAVQSPDPYRVSAYLPGTRLGAGGFRDPQGLFIKNNLIYVCDSGNNRVVVIEGDKGDYQAVKIAASVMIDGVESLFNYPTDIFVTDEGDIYIADMNNQRILRLDSAWNYKSAVLKPADQTFDQAADFLPNKFVVDFAGRIFVKALNINKGFLEFDDSGAFTGYMGANKVVVDIADYFWKLISTRAQRSRLDLFLPTEYNNICLDHEGFIYAVSSFDMSADLSISTGAGDDLNQPVRRLNSMGQDILIRNGHYIPLGDLQIGYGGGMMGPSRFVDVAAFDNDSYACLDQTRGRVFVYDFQGNLLYAFGGVGNREGYFLLPVGIANMGNSLFVLDARAAALTRFDFTTYGDLINEALVEYRSGRYEASAEKWRQVLKINGNNDLAYIGIGRAAFRQGDYRTAMEYYRLKRYAEGYGRALQMYRKQWGERNLWKILLIMGLAIVIPYLVKRVSKIVKDIREA